jgi:hypothetical protein
MEKRYAYEDGVRVDWDFIDKRDAAQAKRVRDFAAKRNLKALRDGVPNTKIGPELSEYLWENTRNRTPDADDKLNAKLLAKQGYENSFIGLALELNPERVADALA